MLRVVLLCIVATLVVATPASGHFAEISKASTCQGWCVGELVTPVGDGSRS